jgi:integrase
MAFASFAAVRARTVSANSAGPLGAHQVRAAEGPPSGLVTGYRVRRAGSNHRPRWKDFRSRIRSMLGDTFASTALAEGVPISEVSRWLGHRSITTTVDLYGHLVPEASGRARDALDKAFRVALHVPPMCPRRS